MDNNISRVLAFALKDKIPVEGLPLLQDRLQNTSEDKLNTLLATAFKSPILGLIFGIAFGQFGLDRFYKGDKTLAIVKVVLWALGFLTVWLFFIGLIFLIPLWIWCIADWFLVWKGIKSDNLNLALQALA